MSDSWLRISRPNPRASLTLYCFPWAGAGSSVFSRWGEELLPDIEVCAIQLPGREDRLREPLRTSLLRLVDELGAVFEAFPERPFAFFGHSLGALVAFELTRLLRRRGSLLPVRLFVSGSEAPDFERSKRSRHNLSDAELVEEVRLLKGTSEAVLSHPDLMALFLSSLRADFQMAETYDCPPEVPLEVPITAFTGTADEEVSGKAVRGWERHSSIWFRVTSIEGGHFFLQTARSELLRLLKEDLLAERQLSSVAGRG